MSAGSTRGYRFGSFVLNLERLSLQEGGSDRELRPKAFDVLRHLVEQAGRLITKDELVETAWPNVIVNDDALAQCIRDIRKVLGDQGDRYIKTVPRRGYIFVGDVERLVSVSSILGEPLPIASRSRGPIWALAAIGVLLTLGAAMLWFLDDRLNTRPRTGLGVAVLPFAATGSDQTYLGEGLAEDVAAAVARFGDLTVIARNSSFRYGPDADDLRQVGRELGVDYVLRGGVRRTGDQLRVTAQLIDTRNLATLWMEQYDRPYVEMPSIPDEVAERVAVQLVGHAREDAAKLLRSHDADNLEAYELVLRGRKSYRTFTKAGALEARDLVERAVVLDPDFAPAWDLMALTLLQFYLQPYGEGWRSRQVLEEARAAAYHAVALEPNSSTAHATLGSVLWWLRDYDAGLDALKKAISLNPNDAVAFVAYAEALSFSGDQEGAIEAWERAAELDPFTPPLNLALKARSYTFLGEPENALTLARSCTTVAPNLQPCFLQLAIAAKEAGQDAEARSAAERVVEINPDFSISRQIQLVPFRRPEDAETFAHLLRRAGLPE
jgi:TolB-like protein/DNA-binding winged helix-turn-helix (wHTH) protein